MLLHFLQPELVAKVVPNRIFSLDIHSTESKLLVAAGGKWGSIGFWDVSDNTSEMHGVQVIKVRFLNIQMYIVLCTLVTNTFFLFSPTQDQSTASLLINLTNVD